MIPEIEGASLRDIKKFQEQKLVELLSYVKENSKYYQRVFQKHNIDISEIKTLESLEKIPVTTKEDLQLYNDDFICVEDHQIIDVVTTSGTLGEPITFVLSDKDLDRLAYNEYLSFACAGITKDDRIQLTTTLDKRFMAGLAYFLGARKLGASIIRVGVGSPELQWDSILKLKPTCLVAVPSFLIKLIAFAKANNIALDTTSVKKVICIGEPIKESDFSPNILAKKIQEDWNVELYSTYASTEKSTAFTECEEQKGGHHHPELIIVEVLDEHDKAVKEGGKGELTITTLGVEAMPLLKYKTGDIVELHQDLCKCGRNTLRVGPVLGRKKQMIKLKGTTIFPQAIKSVLNEVDEVNNYVIKISKDDFLNDKVTIKVEADTDQEILRKTLQQKCKTKIRVTPFIEFVSKREIHALMFPKLGRKPIDVIDERNCIT
ncbi:phenylacetate--CoA ligase family protein [Tenacibaculum caenipelagi]|uniref:Phenylacetate-CoA ligase n=1 Tax=Tenacibaculum caenipelagi TaxID=1325435 RepID=A0A4R6TL35_9FLAO|nr:AMP-binding protein [Tenacibaculum caenipelagi]TDQ28871.1 phenylacetate-CoA ligase [Tenacibaculum caenipelagi]